MSVAYLQALGVTLITELSLLFVLLVFLRRAWRRPLLVDLLTNLVTHRSLWLVFPVLGGPPELRLLGLEVAVTLIEAASLATFGRIRPWPVALGLSVLVNLASYVAGVELL